MARNLDTRHEWYSERERVWKYNRDHYEGGRALVKDCRTYLIRHRVEEEVGYNRRVERAAGLYDNLPARAIQVYKSQLFRHDPDRSRLPSICEDAFEDADLYGTSAKAFFEGVIEDAELDGIHFVLVDAPRKEQGDQTSIAEAQARRLRPWFESIDASKVIDWGIETEDTQRRGMLNYVVIRDENIMEKRQPFEEGRKYDLYRVYTPNEILFIRSGLAADGQTPFEEEQRFVNELGEIPIVAFYSNMIAPMRGDTVIDDVALSANAMWNSASVLDESYQQQGFAVFCIYSDKTTKEIKVGEGRALGFEREDRAEFLAPPPIALEMHTAKKQEILERVADLVFSRTSRQMPTAQVESAEKRDIDRQEFLALLESKASNAEKSESACWRLFTLMAGGGEGEAEEATVEYTRNFRVTERMTLDWQQMADSGIVSLAEWYMHEHPNETDEDEAWKKVKENIKNNRDAKPGFEDLRGLFGEPGGDEDNPPNEEESDEEEEGEEGEEGDESDPFSVLPGGRAA